MKFIMPTKKGGGNAMTGGYAELTADRLKAVKLPDKIKCGRCQKWKSKPNFSNKQLARYKCHKISVNTSVTINCRACTGDQVVELECFMCNETKGLEEFAKAQRSKPDHAKCRKCMELQLEMEPIDESKYDDPEAAVIPDADSYYVDYWQGGSAASENGEEEWGGGGGVENLKLTESSNGSITDDDTTENEFKTLEEVGRKVGTGNRDGVALGGSNWVVQKTKSWRSSSLASSSNANSIIGGLSITGNFDPKGYGYPSRSTSRASSTAGSSASFLTNVMEQFSKTTAGRGGWAKIPAYKPSKPESEEDEESDSEKEWSDKGGDTDSDDSETDL